MKRTINFLGTLHHKNIEGANLMSEFFNIEFNGTTKDIVVHASDMTTPIGNVDIYGPQIDFRIASTINRYPVNFLSEWVSDMAKSINTSCNTVNLPFPVNVDKFKPTEKIGNPIIYFKLVDIELYKEVKSYFSALYPDIFEFDYESKYDEKTYIEKCASAPFCIWLGRHESQGFALQECLSSGTPIFVIDVDSMCDELTKSGYQYWPNNWSIYKATACPYFDNQCGFISNKKDWKSDFDIFINKLDSYKPREYVLENLSPKVISENWINVINKIN